MKPLLVLCLCLWMAACGSSRHLPPVRQAADEFFLEIGENRLRQAYDSTAFSFKAKSSFKSFRAIAKELGLTAGTVACHWADEEPQGAGFKLTGEVITESGTAVPVSVTFIPERGAWRVCSLLTPNQTGSKEEDRFSLLGKGNAFTRSVNQEMPNPKKIDEIVTRSITLFGKAVKKGDFHDFYSEVSMTWQNHLTEKQLENAFQQFIDTKANIDIKSLSPVFDKPPEINSDGVLILNGHYNTKPLAIHFLLQFIYEFPQWKLYGLEVQLKD